MRVPGTGGVLFTVVVGAVAGPLSTNAAVAAGLEASAWAITPEDAACHTDFELIARSGAVAPVTLTSDGEHVALRFTKEGVPSQAFLPIRIDQKPFANLVQRTNEEGLAVMGLSDETLNAMRRGKVLQIAWLSDEAVSISLAGAAQGIADLKICGAQVASQHRTREAELEAQRIRTEADERAQAVADEQLATARAQTAAAEAVRQRASAEAEQLAAQAEQTRAVTEQSRTRTIPAQQQYYYYQDRSRPSQQQQQQSSPWSYYQPYYPR
jgi:vacuolar-type H+-ATPase subunit H